MFSTSHPTRMTASVLPIGGSKQIADVVLSFGYRWGKSGEILLVIDPRDTGYWSHMADAIAAANLAWHSRQEPVRQAAE